MSSSSSSPPRHDRRRAHADRQVALGGAILQDARRGDRGRARRPGARQRRAGEAGEGRRRRRHGRDQRSPIAAGWSWCAASPTSVARRRSRRRSTRRRRSRSRPASSGRSSTSSLARSAPTSARGPTKQDRRRLERSATKVDRSSVPGRFAFFLTRWSGTEQPMREPRYDILFEPVPIGPVVGAQPLLPGAALQRDGPSRPDRTRRRCEGSRPRAVGRSCAPRRSRSTTRTTSATTSRVGSGRRRTSRHTPAWSRRCTSTARWRGSSSSTPA